MNAKTFRRDTCRICGSSLLELVVPLQPIPLSEKFSDSKTISLAAKRFPIDVYQCLECTHIQQVDIIDPDDLWDGYSYFSGNTPNMSLHFTEESKEIILFADQYNCNHSIVEIGSNDGTFLLNFARQGWKVLGVDPATMPSQQAHKNGVPTLTKLYSCAVNDEIIHRLGRRPSLVLAYNVFAHMDEIGSILTGISQLIDDSSVGLFRFEVQYAKCMVEKCLVASIFHEHVNHYSLASLSRFLSSAGMYIIDAKVDHDIQHGSLIVTATHIRHRALVKQTNRLRDLLAEERTSGSVGRLGLLSFAKRIVQKRTILNSLLADITSQGKQVSGYGASRSASTIISQLAINKFISDVYDEDPKKVGKYIAGEGLLIKSTANLEPQTTDCIIILAWVHAQHIIQKLKPYILEGGMVINIFPKITVIDQHKCHYLEA